MHAMTPPLAYNSLELQAHSKFPYKLHDLLENAVLKGFECIVSWLPCGTGFKVHDQKAFEEFIMPLYFPGMTSYTSFRRQLNMYGMHQESMGTNGGILQGAYSHSILVRNQRHLCALIQRNTRNRKKTNKKSEKRGIQPHQWVLPPFEDESCPTHESKVPLKCASKIGQERVPRTSTDKLLDCHFEDACSLPCWKIDEDNCCVRQQELLSAINEMILKLNHHGGSWASPDVHEDRGVCSGSIDSVQLFEDGSWQDIEGDSFSQRFIEDEIISTFQLPY